MGFYGDVKHTPTGRSGEVFSGVTNYTPPSGNPMDVSGFGSFQVNSTCLNALCIGREGVNLLFVCRVL